MEEGRKVSFEAAESVELEGDDERTENERSPDIVCSKNKHKLYISGECGSRQARATSGGGGCRSGANPSRRASRPRNRPNHRRSSSASGSETGQPHPRFGRPQMALNTVPNHEHQQQQQHDTRGSPQQTLHQENVKNGEENIKRKRRNNRKRTNRKYKPYARLTWKEKKELDELQSRRATKRRANRPTPYNTTQFLMEDHKVVTPDLSTGMGNRIPLDSSDELFDENDDIRDGDFLEREFSAMYDEVQSERLQSMSKEQLVSEVLTLSKRVTELEENQQTSENRTSDENLNGHSNSKVDNIIRKRLESLDELEHEVKRLREENLVLKNSNEFINSKH